MTRQLSAWALALGLLCMPATHGAAQEKKAPKASDVVVATVDGEPVLAADVEREARSNVVRHQGPVQGEEAVRWMSLERAIENVLVTRDARRTGLIKEPGYRLREMRALEAFLAERLRERVTAEVRVAPAEVEAAVPDTWDVFTVEAFFFDSPEGAAEGRRRLESGEDPGVRGVRMEPAACGRSVFEDEIDRQICALPKGGVSQVLVSGRGPMVAVVRSRDSVPAERLKEQRTALEAGLLTAKREKAWTDLLASLKSAHRYRVDEAAVMARAAGAGGDLAKLAKEEAGRFDGRSVTFDEVRLMLEDQKARGAKTMRTVGELARSLAENALLAAEARRRGLDQGPEYLTRSRTLSRAMIVEMTLEKIYAGVKRPTDGELRELVAKKPELATVPEEAVVRYLWLQDRGRAEEAARRAKAGEDFGALIKEYSLDPGPKGGGAPTPFRRGATTASFENVAFDLPPGGISPLVETASYFFVIEKVEQRPERRLSFEELREKLGEEVYAKRKKDAVAKHLKELRASAKVTIDEGKLGALDLSPRGGSH